MGTVMGRLNPHSLQAFAGQPMQCTAGQGSKRWGEREKECTMGTGRPDDLEVADDRGAYGRYQRIRGGVSRFGAWRPDQVLVPIEMVEPQLGDLPSAPPIEGEEHEDRTVADVPGVLGIEGAQEFLHRLPGGPCR